MMITDVHGDEYEFIFNEKGIMLAGLNMGLATSELKPGEFGKVKKYVLEHAFKTCLLGCNREVYRKGICLCCWTEIKNS